MVVSFRGIFNRYGFLNTESVYAERGKKAWIVADPIVEPDLKLGLVCDPCKANMPGYQCWGEVWCSKVNKVTKLYCTPLNKIQ